MNRKRPSSDTEPPTNLRRERFAAQPDTTRHNPTQTDTKRYKTTQNDTKRHTTTQATSGSRGCRLPAAHCNWPRLTGCGKRRCAAHWPCAASHHPKLEASDCRGSCGAAAVAAAAAGGGARCCARSWEQACCPQPGTVQRRTTWGSRAPQTRTCPPTAAGPACGTTAGGFRSRSPAQAAIRLRDHRLVSAGSAQATRKQRAAAGQRQSSAPLRSLGTAQGRIASHQ